MKIIYDIRAFHSRYKTGIPNYTLSLGKALMREGAELHGATDKYIFDENSTRRIFSQVEKSWEKRGRSDSLLSRRLEELMRRASSLLRRFRNGSPKPASQDHYEIPSLLTSNQFFPRIHSSSLFTLYDLSPLDLPETHEEGNVRIFLSMLEELKARVSAGERIQVVAISEFTKQRFIEVMGSEFAAITHVIYPGIDTEIFCGKAVPKDLENPFLLSVGTLEPRKNLALLLKAFADVAPHYKNLRLKIVGALGWKNESILTAIEKHPFSSRIDRLGYVSDEMLASLYRSCEAFCYPSVYEGFGLPVAEARACGAKVVILDTPAVIEAAKGQAYISKENAPESYARSINEALNSSTEPGTDNQSFTWARSARSHLDLIIKSSRLT